MSMRNAKHPADLEIFQIFVQLNPILEVDNLFPSKFKNSFAGTLSGKLISFGFLGGGKNHTMKKTILSSL
jgi:hypothetical protein